MPSTIYVAPGASRCRVYHIPYPMRRGQSPRDIDPKYQKDWKEVAMLNHRLELVYIAQEFKHLADEIAGQMGGTYFEI